MADGWQKPELASGWSDAPAPVRPLSVFGREAIVVLVARRRLRPLVVRPRGRLLLARLGLVHGLVKVRLPRRPTRVLNTFSMR